MALSPITQAPAAVVLIAALVAPQWGGRRLGLELARGAGCPQVGGGTGPAGGSMRQSAVLAGSKQGPGREGKEVRALTCGRSSLGAGFSSLAGKQRCLTWMGERHGWMEFWREQRARSRGSGNVPLQSRHHYFPDAYAQQQHSPLRNHGSGKTLGSAVKLRAHGGVFSDLSVVVSFDACFLRG